MVTRNGMDWDQLPDAAVTHCEESLEHMIPLNFKTQFSGRRRDRG
jgi:hypothetical protein